MHIKIRGLTRTYNPHRCHQDGDIWDVGDWVLLTDPVLRYWILCCMHIWLSFSINVHKIVFLCLVYMRSSDSIQDST